MRIEPARCVRGNVDIPGDKSISHRYAILGGMSRGRTTIRNFSSSEDCQSTLSCLGALGVEIEKGGRECSIWSEGWRSVSESRRPLDAGNSGTTIRLLSALLAARPMKTEIGGDESLNSRPMRRIIAPLTQMGAQIEAEGDEFPPLRIQGAQLQPITYRLPVASAQVKSCVLLAGLTATGTTSVIETLQSRDHTERALPVFGGTFSRDGSTLSVTGPADLKGADVVVPGDFSSAVYFICASLLLPASQIRVRNVGVNPTRIGFLRLLENTAAQIRREESRTLNGEPVCDLVISSESSFAEGFPSEIGGDWIPNLIDEIPALAVLGTRLPAGLTVRDAGELRKKESDRIHSVVVNLRRVGVEIEERDDGFRIPGAQSIKGGEVETFGDHRIAMAFAIAGLISEGGVELDRPECAGVSFPHFYDVLESIVT